MCRIIFRVDYPDKQCKEKWRKSRGKVASGLLELLIDEESLLSE